MPTARFGLAAVPVDGKIYVICGWGAGGFERVVEVYDPATDTWETKAPYPEAIGHGGFAGFEGKIYMFGGTAGQFNDTTATRVYDPVADQWESKASMPSARILPSATVLDGKFYVLGGNLPDPSGNAPATDTVAVYDPGTDTWAEGLSMPTARGGLSAVKLNGKIYAIGGHTGLTFENVGTVYDTVEAFTPQTPTPFKITDIDVTEGAESSSVTLIWQSRPGRTYAVFTSEDLQVWTELNDSVDSGGDQTTFIEEAISVKETSRYYRVEDTAG